MENSEVLRKIQMCQLDILKTIDKVCRQNNIKYWLAYGSFLGAVREKGFIPWDDDLDIHMTMKDFKKFEKCCKEVFGDDYFLQTPKSEPSTKWIYYKVRKNNTLMLEPSLEQEKNNFYNGIWVDVFPLINLGKTKRLGEAQIKQLKKLQRLRWWHLVPGDNTAGIKRRVFEKLLCFYEKILWGVVMLCGSKASDYYLAIENEFYDNKTEEDIKRAMFKKEIFGKNQRYVFEDGFFNGVSDYDAYLTQIYGKDYMTPRRYGEHLPDYSNVIVD